MMQGCTQASLCLVLTRRDEFALAEGGWYGRWRVEDPSKRGVGLGNLGQILTAFLASPVLHWAAWACASDFAGAYMSNPIGVPKGPVCCQNE